MRLSLGVPLARHRSDGEPLQVARSALLAVGLLLVSGAAWAEGVRATVNRTEATLEDQIVLTVTVEGGGAERPELPDLSDFDVYPRGQSQQMSFVNGRISRSVSFNFVLVPKKVGTFTVGPVTAEISGQRYQSKPFVVRVVGAQSQPRKERDVFVTARVSTDTPWVGQQVVYTWRLYNRVRITDAQLEPQEFDGFLVESLGDVKEYQTTVGGQVYQVHEIRKALFPQEAGKQVIPAARLTCGLVVRGRSGGGLVEDFFGRYQTQTKVLRTAPIELQVRPRPPAPAGFSGLVGQFDLDAKLTKMDLQVGESTTLELKVSGTGNVQSIPEPKLPELPQFKVYDDKPVEAVKRNGEELSGRKTFHKALVPQEPGEIAVPPVRLVYFDPAAGRYRTLSTPAISLSVRPAANQEELRLTELANPTSGKVAVEILADDILPIYKELDALGNARPTEVQRAVWLGGLVAPPFLFALLLVSRRRQERLAHDAGLRRRREAGRRARNALRELASYASDGRREEAARVASRCVRELVGDKLGVEGAALTAAEIDAELREARVPPEVVGRATTLLGELEAAQYDSGRSTGRALAELPERVGRVVKELEAAL